MITETMRGTPIERPCQEPGHDHTLRLYWLDLLRATHHPVYAESPPPAGARLLWAASGTDAARVAGDTDFVEHPIYYATPTEAQAEVAQLRI